MLNRLTLRRLSVLLAATGLGVAGPAADAAADAATSDARIAVPPTPQTISFTAPAMGTVHSSSTFAATASSGLTVVLSVDPATTNGACAVSADTVAYAHAGDCVLDANQAGDATYSAAPQVQRTIVVGPTTQTIAFVVVATGMVDGSLTMTPAASSGLAVVLSVDAATTNGACTLAGTTVTYHHAGSCVLDANQAGNADYSAAPQVRRTIAVSRATQTIALAAPVTGTVGGSGTVTASASSGLAVALSVDPATTNGACTLTGTTVVYRHAGSCVLDANQAGDADHAPATQVRQTSPVSPATQAISFVGPATATVNDSSTITATASSGLAVALSVDSATTNLACTLAGTTVFYHHAGSCVIDATQAGDADHAAAAEVQRTISVGPAAQTIAFAAPPTGTVGGSGTVTANASSGLAVTLSVDGATTNGACSLTGTAVAYEHAGSCVLDADQAGDADYSAAPEVQQTTTVVDGPPGAIRSLSVSLAGSGGGSVNASGIDCPGTCAASYPAGTTVALAATPASGSTFAGWSGGCGGTGSCTVTMGTDQAVTATFTANPTPPPSPVPPGAPGLPGVPGLPGAGLPGAVAPHAQAPSTATLSAVTAFNLPSAAGCVSGRRLTIRLRKVAGVKWVGAVIRVNGKRVKTVGRTHVTGPVNLTRLPQGRFVLSITARTSGGRSITGRRTYHACVARRRTA